MKIDLERERGVGGDEGSAEWVASSALEARWGVLGILRVLGSISMMFYVSIVLLGSYVSFSFEVVMAQVVNGPGGKKWQELELTRYTGALLLYPVTDRTHLARRAHPKLTSNAWAMARASGVPN